MKKTLNWLFRHNLELHKHWWHRLVKVISLSIFCVIAIIAYIVGIVEPNDSFLSKHNIAVNNTLAEFSKNYKGEDYANTIPEFFEQKGSFGLLINGNIEYVSQYSLGKSVCIKNPEKYLEGISKMLYQDYLNDPKYTHSESEESFAATIKKDFYSDKTRQCYIFGLNDKTLEKKSPLSTRIINYRPSIIYYLEFTLFAILVTFISFIVCALVYYRLILYVIFGNK